MDGLIVDIWRGKTMLRSLMNRRISRVGLYGDVIDIGGGFNPEYHNFFKKDPNKPAKFVVVDLKDSADKKINLETDHLPFSDYSADYVLMFNLLEHVYNHMFVVSEAFRILKSSGRLIGFVPFLVNYHPDPHDYFRYTKEALMKIFSSAGFSEINIEEIGRGPFAVNYNNLVLSMPRFLRVLLLPFHYLLDSIMLGLRPKIGERYPLGYFFEARVIKVFRDRLN